MNNESLELTTTVNESLAQYYSQVHAILIASDISKKMKVLSLFSVMMRVCYTCHYLMSGNLKISPLHKPCIHKLCRKTCLPEYITILTMENKRQYI